MGVFMPTGQTAPLPNPVNWSLICTTVIFNVRPGLKSTTSESLYTSSGASLNLKCFLEIAGFNLRTNLNTSTPLTYNTQSMVNTSVDGRWIVRRRGHNNLPFCDCSLVVYCMMTA